MRVNDLQLNSDGVILKCGEENNDLWKAQLTDTLVDQGYKKLRDTRYTDSYHMAFYHLNHDSVTVDGFDNGYIQISTKDTTRLFSTIIPALEKSLPVIFNYVSPDKSTLEKQGSTKAVTRPSSCMLDYVKGRVDSTRWRSTEMESNAVYQRMQGEIEEAKKKLTTTKTDLSDTEAKLENLSGDLETFNEKRKDELQRSFEYYYPQYYSKYGGAYQRYLEERPFRRYQTDIRDIEKKYLTWKK